MTFEEIKVQVQNFVQENLKTIIVTVATVLLITPFAVKISVIKNQDSFLSLLNSKSKDKIEEFKREFKAFKDKVEVLKKSNDFKEDLGEINKKISKLEKDSGEINQKANKVEELLRAPKEVDEGVNKLNKEFSEAKNTLDKLQKSAVKAGIIPKKTADGTVNNKEGEGADNQPSGSVV